METKNVKKWLTLNQHGKICLKNFLIAISASDIWQSQLDYLYKKYLVDYETTFKGDLEGRSPIANHALTDLGKETALHYFPKYL